MQAKEEAEEEAKEFNGVIDLNNLAIRWVEDVWWPGELKRINNIKLGIEGTVYSQKPPKKFSDVQFEVDWRNVSVVRGEVEYEDSKKPEASQTTVFQATFTNNTDSEQEYSLKTERVTKQVCSFSFTDGYNRKNESNIKFNLEEVLEDVLGDVLESSGGGLKREFSIENGKNETKWEDFTWSIDSRIKVGPNSSTTASVNMTELNFDKKFSIETKMSGKIEFKFYNIRDNYELYYELLVEVAQIIKECVSKGWFPSKSSSFIFAPPYVSCFVRGQCNFKLGVEQHVSLTENKRA
jgi:hypothetical protein